MQEIIVQITNFLSSSDGDVAPEMQWCRMTDEIQATVSHLLSGQLMGVRRSSAAILLAGPPAGHGRPQEPGQPLLPRAPEVLDVVVRPAGQVRRDPGPFVPDLRLQVDHHALLLRRELAPPVEEIEQHCSVLDAGLGNSSVFEFTRPLRG